MTMISVDIDESLREQSQLLLRKLKEKQSRLQNIVGTSCSGDLSTVSSSGITNFTSRMHAKNKYSFQVNNTNSNVDTNVKEKLDATLEKSVTTLSGKEGKSRLNGKVLKPNQEKENAILRNGKTEKANNKENFMNTYRKNVIEYKTLNSGGQGGNVGELRARSRELDAEMDILKDAIEDTERNAGSRTPDSALRRNIIDRNVKVNSMVDMNASELLHECEDDFHKLNYSYSNSEDADLKYLQEKLGLKENDEHEMDDNVPVHDTNIEKSFNQNLSMPGNSRKVAKFIRETKKPKSILLSTSSRQNKSVSGNSSRVSFRSPPSKDSSSNLTYEMDVASKHQQKMLGYDWIAALLENDPQVVNQSETYFEELKQFRKLNLEECVNQMYMDGPQELWEHPEREPSPVQKALEETKVKPYVVNDRLFAEPIKRSMFADHDYEESGASHNKEREPTYDEPRFVRVSIPRSTLMSSYRVKPHRRGSFDGSDSMALSQHCLKGFNSTQPSKMPATTSVALRDSTRGIKSAVKTTLDNAESLAANYPYEWNPSEQSICRPLPRPTYCPEASYSDSLWPSALHSNTSSFTPSDELKKATDDLLNSTYSLMYEMKRLKNERSDNPLRV